MKIVFITVDLKITGGIQRYSIDFIKALEDEQVLTVQFKGSNLISKILFVLSVFFKFLTFRPDIVICGHINFAVLGFLIKRIFHRNYIVMTYGIDVWNITEKQTLYFKNAKVISSISAYTKSRILTAIPELEAKIFILPNTIDGDRFKPKQRSVDLVKKLGIGNNKVILTLCRLAKSEKYKGYDKLIQVLPDIIREIKNIKYILAGDGDDSPRIRQLVKNLGMENYVIMPGYLSEEDLVDYYNACDVFVMTSKGEGFGFVFLEALACGKPVVAGNKDGSVEAILGGRVGILVNPDDINEISKTIIKILKREIPAELLNPDYLRGNILEAYGFNKFKGRVKSLLSLVLEA